MEVTPDFILSTYDNSQKKSQMQKYHKISKYLTVKDVLWSGLLKFDVPYKGNTIWFMRSIFIIVIRGHQQLRIL